MAEKIYGDGGDYFEDDPSSILKPSDQAAAEFLEILDEIEPGVHDRLRHDVLPQLPADFAAFGRDRALALRLAGFLKEQVNPSLNLRPDLLERLRQFGLEPGTLDDGDEALEARFQELRRGLAEPLKSLAQWIRVFRLFSRPVIQLAVETLADWKYLESKGESGGARWGQRVPYFANPMREETPGELTIPMAGTVASLDPPRDFELHVQGAWDPFQEPWSAAESRLRLAFEERLNSFRQEVRDQAALQGAKAPSRRSPKDHLKWLALYQVQGLSHQAIAEQSYRDRKSVSEGIKSAAKLIELTLRPIKPGRPVGRKESRRRRRLG